LALILATERSEARGTADTTPTHAHNSIRAIEDVEAHGLEM
jgi:hypothetical protein